jgi:hypothetical protein
VVVVVTALVGLWSCPPLFIIWFIHPRGMGFGDVRLVVLLGWSVGYFAGSRPMAGVVLAICCLTLSSLLGLVIGVAALGARGRKAQVPFGPALIIATWFCVAMAPDNPLFSPADGLSPAVVALDGHHVPPLPIATSSLSIDPLSTWSKTQSRFVHHGQDDDRSAPLGGAAHDRKIVAGLAREHLSESRSFKSRTPSAMGHTADLALTG